MNHATIIFLEYNAAPSMPCFKALNQAMECVYPHPCVPIMYPRKEVITPSINVHYTKGEGEIINIKKISDYTGMKQYIDTYLAKDIATCRPVSCIIHEYNKVAFVWKANKNVKYHTVPTRLKQECSLKG